MIIETSTGKLFQVREADDASLAHVWIGVPVRREGGKFVALPSARTGLVRKASATVIREA